ncbi:MAG: RHS repeat-associated core domain-containing protein, partial [Xanthomonadales bacterium]|nr:RHS repeat-associated core domain-containing protein [Xanthomonadales bacterium]
GSFTSPRGYASTFDWGLQGRLLKDTNAEGGYKALMHEKTSSWQYDIGVLTTAMNRQSSVGSRNVSTGSVRRWAIAEDDSYVSEWIDRSFNRNVEKISTGEWIASIYEPDPRFGVQAVYPGATTISVPGLSPQRRTTTRAAVPTTPDADIGQLDLGVQVDINGRKYTQLYDSASRSWGITSPEGRTQTVIIDAQSRPVKQQVPGLADVDYTYDARGRLHTITAGSGAEQRQWTFGYDANGYLNRVQDPLNRETLLTRDVAGRTLAQTLPGSRTIQMAWDANNNLTSLTPPGGSAHQFSYNKVDRVTAYAPPLLGATSTATGYQDNLDSQLDQITDADARVAAVGFVATSSLPQSLSLPDESRSFTYSAGRLTGVSSDTGIGNAIQWAGSLPTGETWTGPMAGSVALQYDATNNRSNFWVAKRTVTDAAATAFDVDYAYDRDGLPTQVSAHKTGMPAAELALTWSPQHGLLTSTQLGRVNDVWSYNLFAEPLNYSATLDGAALYSVSYTRDKLGRITHKEETLQGSTHSFAYSYDVAGRLTHTTRDGVSVGAWTWDANGNRLSTSDGATTIACQYDAQDRAIACGSEGYGWNKSGQLTAITDSAAGTSTSFQYDMLGNLQQVNLPDGRRIDYLVDGLDRRIGKKIDGGLVQGFLYQDGLRPVAELDGSGTIVSLFVYADRANVPTYLLKGGRVYRIFTDQLGSPRLVIDTQTGAIAQRLDYDAWGKVLDDTNPGFQPFGFAGGLYDLDTGLVRFGARDYDPTTGRWTAKDPIRFGGGDSNLYAYVGNDPINRIDPSGLSPEGGFCLAQDYLKRFGNDAERAWEEAMTDRIARGWEARDPYGADLRNAENYLWARQFVEGGASRWHGRLGAWVALAYMNAGWQVSRAIQNAFGQQLHSPASLDAYRSGILGGNDGMSRPSPYVTDCGCVGK